MDNNQNVVELQNTPKGWEAKIFDDGKSEYGFLPTPYTQSCPIERVFDEIQSFNPEHQLILV